MSELLDGKGLAEIRRVGIRDLGESSVAARLLALVDELREALERTALHCKHLCCEEPCDIATYGLTLLARTAPPQEPRRSVDGRLAAQRKESSDDC